MSRHGRQAINTEDDAYSDPPYKYYQTCYRRRYYPSTH